MALGEAFHYASTLSKRSFNTKHGSSHCIHEETSSFFYGAKGGSSVPSSQIVIIGHKMNMMPIIYGYAEKVQYLNM